MKIEPHIYSRLLNELRECCLIYKDSQQLRAQLSKVLSKYVKPDHKES